MRIIAGLETLWHDLRFGLRLLRRHPTFALVAILILALGTGANAAIFQLVNALRLRSLPVAAPQELVSLGIDQHGKGRPGLGRTGGVFTVPLWREIRSQQQAFSSIVAWTTERWNLSTDGEAVWVRGQYVSGDYFTALGVPARTGRVFVASDDRAGCASSGAVLSHSFWQAHYAGDSGAIGQHLSLDGHSFEIIGVAAEGFSGLTVGRTFDVALPLCAEPIVLGQRSLTDRRDAWWLGVMARIKPDWTPERAQSHLAAISPSVFQGTLPTSYKPEWAKSYAAFTLTATPGATGVSLLRLQFATPLWALMGVTGLVLVLTCANLANLMLARATARSREIAVRLAIGASRRRIIRQLLAESAVVAIIGALAGALFAQWMSRTLVAFLNTGANQVFLELSPDWRVFGFIAGIAALTCLISGLSPALKVTRRDLAADVQGGGRSASDGHEAIRLRRGLVVVQIAISIVLVVGALLFTGTLRNLSAVNLGFSTNVIEANVDLRRTSVAPAARSQAFAAIRARLQQVPGVLGAGETLITPLSGPDWNGGIVKNGVVQAGDGHFNEVGGRYFQAMEIPLLAGRTFDDRDRVDTPKVVVVNQTFARQFFADANPIGQTFRQDLPSPQPDYLIVGIVGDTKIRQIRDERMTAAMSFTSGDTSAPFFPIAYLAATQDAAMPPDFRIVIRTDLPAASLTRELTRAVTSEAPGASVSYRSVSSYIDGLLSTERLMAWLSVFFGILAMLIAAIGLYGVMAYLVSRRRVEIGIRMALGATPGSVIRLILGESGQLLLGGIAAGVALTLAASRYAAALLFGLSPMDPMSFAIGAGGLALVSLAACYIPARRATRIDPTVALRDV